MYGPLDFDVERRESDPRNCVSMVKSTGFKLIQMTSECVQKVEARLELVGKAREKLEKDFGEVKDKL